MNTFLATLAVQPPTPPTATGSDAAAIAAAIPTADQIYQPIDSAIASIQSMPWGIHAAMGVLVVTGLVLWMVGRKVLKPVAGLIGAGVGAFLGFAALPVMFPTAGISPYVGLFAGMVIGLIGAIMLCKLATAAAFAIIVAVATAFITGGVLNMRGEPAVDPSAPTAPSGTRTGDQLASGIDRALGGGDPVPGAADQTSPSFFTDPNRKSIDDYPNLGPAAATVRDFVRSVRLMAAERWNATPAAHRPWVALFGTGALVLAFVLGFFLWNWSSSVVTALIGSAVWLSAGAWLWHAGSLPGHDKLAGISPANWAIVWLVVGVIGMVIQLKTSRKPAPAAAPAPAPPAA